MTQRFDVIILGGGNAGFGVSQVVEKAGLSLAFVEGRDFGGTCPNRGCTPKKFLVAAAHALHEIERAPVHGIEVGPARLDWARLIDRERSMIADIPDKMREAAAGRGAVFEGRARFVGPDSVAVGDTVLEAGHVVVATGSTPRPLPFEGASLLATSDDVLAERDLPGEVVFVGGGVIAMEFSHVYARAGARVTVLEAMPRLLGNLDAGGVAAIRAESERIGIDFHTDVEVARVERDGDRFAVVYRHDGAEHRVGADRVINGAGRVADVDGLDLDAGGVEHDGGRIAVDAYLRSKSNPSVWVCGDALAGSPQLSPLATYEGRVVGRNIVDGPVAKPDYSVVPSCVYTVPAFASVGLTEAQAEERGLEVDVVTNDMTEWFSSLTYGETVAWAKVLVDRDADRVLGAHLVGHHGEELIHLFAMAMRHGIPASALADSLYGFPTYSADVKSLV